MSKQFLKATEVKLINGGYLSDNNGNPVSNTAFVQAQRDAEYVITFATLAKGKDFTGKKADSLTDLRNEVAEALKAKQKSFVEKPEFTENTLTKQLAEEALSFMNFTEKSSNVDKINAFLQKFTILSEFSEFGLFFEQDIVKLNKIYTIDEVVSSVKEVISLLA